MALVELENMTGRAQRVYGKGGEVYLLPPRTSLSFKEDVAQLFLKQRPGLVRIASDNDTPEIRPGEKTMWLANMTGSPFVDDVFTFETVKREKTPAGVITSSVKETVPNPASQAKTLKWDMQVGQGNDPYGRIQTENEFFNLPAKPIVLKPYRREIFGKDVALWILQRVGMIGVPGAVMVMECREPTSFEPTMTWPLEHIIHYAQLIDPEGFSDVVLKAMVQKYDRGGGRPSKGDMARVADDPELLDNVKNDLINRLFFRLVDPQFNLPDEAAFKASMARTESRSAS